MIYEKYKPFAEQLVKEIEALQPKWRVHVSYEPLTETMAFRLQANVVFSEFEPAYTVDRLFTCDKVDELLSRPIGEHDFDLPFKIMLDIGNEAGQLAKAWLTDYSQRVTPSQAG